VLVKKLPPEATPDQAVGANEGADVEQTATVLARLLLYSDPHAHELLHSDP
jgi:hypothetical protein